MSEQQEKLVTRYSILLSIYGLLLNDDNRQLMQLYYDEDLSLAEIADTHNMSRQAVSSSLQRQRHLLDRYDHVLGLTERENWLLEKLDDVQTLVTGARQDEALTVLEEIKHWLREY